MKRFFLAGAAGILAATGVPVGASNESVSRFEAELAARRHFEAAEIYDSLAQTRNRAGEAAPDPVLYAMVGRLLLAMGHSQAAAAYLERAEPDRLFPLQRSPTLFALYEARLRIGDRAGAGAVLDRLEREDLDPAARTRLALTAAEHGMAAEPMAALASLGPFLIDDDPEVRWQAEMLAAQVNGLAGNLSAAARGAERAWALAPRLAGHQLAPLRTALLMAGFAAARGDREALSAMLIAANLAASHHSASGYLPICGRRGLGAGDRATFAVYRDLDGAQHLMPLHASRQGIADIYLDAMVGHDLLQQGAGAPAGFVLTLSCRSHPASGDRPAPGVDSLSEWLAERGLLGYLGLDPDGLREEIRLIEGRFGTDHPPLIPLRMALLQHLEEEGPRGSEVEGLRRRLQADFRREGNEAAAAIYELAGRVEREMSAAARQGKAAEHSGRLRAAMAENLALDHAYRYAADWGEAPEDIPLAQRQRVVGLLLRRFEDHSGDPRRRTLLVRAGELHREAGDLAAARTAFLAAGLAPDICAALDEPPEIEEHFITPDDYPPLSLANTHEGVTEVEFDLGADGRISGYRLIQASPSLLFDETVAQAVRRFQVRPGRRNGRAVACRSMTTRIVWRMPQSVNYDPPTSSPGVLLFPRN